MAIKYWTTEKNKIAGPAKTKMYSDLKKTKQRCEKVFKRDTLHTLNKSIKYLFNHKPFHFILDVCCVIAGDEGDPSASIL